MTRRRAKSSQRPPADLLHGWQTDLFRPPDKGLFGAVDQPVNRTAKPTERPDADVSTALTTYTVHCYVTVCVKLTGIVAGSHREAAKLAQECFDWNSHDGEVEFVDELHEMLVDVAGDPDYSRSVAFTADLEPVR